MSPGRPLGWMSIAEPVLDTRSAASLRVVQASASSASRKWPAASARRTGSAHGIAASSERARVRSWRGSRFDGSSIATSPA